MSCNLLKDERGQIGCLILLLLLLAPVALLGGAAAVILLLAPMALFLYIWRIIFPFFRSIADWLTNRMNCLPFFLFMLTIISVTLALLVIWFVLLPDHPSVIWLILPLILIPILSIALLFFNSALGLAIILWLIRLNQHLFIRFRTWFLTTAFRIVMWRAKRRQAREERPPRRPNKRLRRLIKKRRKKEPPEDRE